MPKLNFRFLKKKLLLIPLVALIFIAAKNYSDFEISRNLEIFATLFRQLNTNYAEDINPGKLTKTALDAMLHSLDPYTVYIPEADIEDYRMAQGSQSGSVGFMVKQVENKHVIVSMNSSSPAIENGLRIGDVLLTIDDNSLDGRTAEEVNFLLNGQTGTSVQILAKRPFTGELLPAKIERSHIKELTVPWSGMSRENIAYVSLKTFSQTASSDVKKAMLELTSDHKIEGLILDLRGNGGGLLLEAVNIANFFVKQNEMIVSTRGRVLDRNKIYRTFTSPVDMQIPVVILVDAMSASASEIVAGALQDLDRAVIIGQNTYGKGLVQNVVPLVYNAQLKVTIAKYYIPSGRCIQSVDYFNPDGFHTVPDSLISPFKTRNGRVVFDGKGIIPDVVVEKKPLSPVAQALQKKHLIFDFATQFRIKYNAIDEPEKFTITPKIWDEFTDFVNLQAFSYQTGSEDKLGELMNVMKREGYHQTMEKEIAVLTDAFEKIRKEDFNRNKKEIVELLRKEIIYRYYYDTGLVKASLAHDQELKEAYRLISKPEEINKLLGGGYRSL